MPVSTCGSTLVGQLRRDAVDRLADLLLGGREVGAVGERRRMIEAFVVLVAVVRFEPGDALDRGLDRRRHVVVDDLGRGARVGRDDDELRELERGDELLLEAREREPAEDGRDDRDEGDERAVLQAQNGKIRHGGLSMRMWATAARRTVDTVLYPVVLSIPRLWMDGSCADARWLAQRRPCQHAAEHHAESRQSDGDDQLHAAVERGGPIVAGGPGRGDLDGDRAEGRVPAEQPDAEHRDPGCGAGERLRRPGERADQQGAAEIHGGDPPRVGRGRAGENGSIEHEAERGADPARDRHADEEQRAHEPATRGRGERYPAGGRGRRPRPRRRGSRPRMRRRAAAGSARAGRCRRRARCTS